MQSQQVQKTKAAGKLHRSLFLSDWKQNPIDETHYLINQPPS
jgi:hypothetical protein